MSSKPLVSSITIFLNGEQFIQEAIQSAIASSDEHWELLVDDGSSDRSTKIAQQYAKQYPDLSAISPPCKSRKSRHECSFVT